MNAGHAARDCFVLRRNRARVGAWETPPPQFERSDPTVVKESVKRLDPDDRARLLAWLLLYFNDDGMMYSPQISRRRQRIALDGVEYWLVRVPNRNGGVHLPKSRR
jgi:hypothetical protein